MRVTDVFAWIKTLPVAADHYYCGFLNDKKDKSVGVYQLKDRRARDIALGGLGTTKTAVKGISLLVHWNHSTRETEEMAASIYNAISSAPFPTIGGQKVNYIKLLHDEPIDVGTDENGICESVIEFVMYYERG